MTRSRILVPVAVGLALSGPAAARGTDFPRFSLSGTCALERTAGARFDAASYRSCLSDERAARRTLRRRWASFPPADRQNCREENEIGGPPSYVALLTCLQLAADTLPFRPAPMPRPGATGR
ncbi:hypothetical protein VQ02_01925 [Methylobacterium variabile]|jgi:hypothetical protein|uniref:Lysozyme inhibitor LprI N-terminal domain-containing protein n=1 Tax=Methylobacterium variabile TaxID=298794 RepID=A0A0J6TAA4_9HYPH|nr:hypothetical protein [Methylobacterium variabile]KMO42827.1 hypothetical protein VQ02_01925 [Methylobacterium variabile]